jgi:hypothetical protein
MSLDYPQLRENVWQISPGSPVSYVDTPDGTFEVPTEQALAFLAVRPYCTPHNSVEDIVRRSGVSIGAVTPMLEALSGIGLIADDAVAASQSNRVALREVHAKFRRITAIWSEEIGRSFIGANLANGELPRDVLVGWLLETYHYVRDFPAAIAVGAAQAQGALKTVLERYVREETGHESFVLRTLRNLGLTQTEIEQSRPLVSTRLISLLMRELFEAYPCAVLLMAAMVEAQDPPEDEIEALQARICEAYDLPPNTLRPYFEHQTVDSALGHCRLLDDNIALFDVSDRQDLDRIADQLHDLKHAFDLQALEILDYYSHLDGKYFPRQPMTYRAL